VSLEPNICVYNLLQTFFQEPRICCTHSSTETAKLKLYLKAELTKHTKFTTIALIK